MKKRGKAYAVLAIVFGLLNVIAFSVPTDKTATFWITYAFTVIAFAVQVGIWQIAFKSNAGLKSKFLGIPIISVGIIYLVAQIIAFTVFLIFPVIASWIAVIVCAVIFGLSATALIGTEVGRKEIDRVEGKVGKGVFYIKSLQADIELLAMSEADDGTKERLIKLAQMIRFSDPMSSDKLSDIEAKISGKVAELRNAENKSELIEEIELLLTERNKKAKLLK